MLSHTERLYLREFCFLIAIIVIATVSLYDTYLICRYQSEIMEMEENPIGCWLLQLGGGHIGVFVRTKLAGTVFVLSTLIMMWHYRMRIVFPVTTSVESYQIGLFMYLTVV